MVGMSVVANVVGVVGLISMVELFHPPIGLPVKTPLATLVDVAECMIVMVLRCVLEEIVVSSNNSVVSRIGCGRSVMMATDVAKTSVSPILGLAPSHDVLPPTTTNLKAPSSVFGSLASTTTVTTTVL